MQLECMSLLFSPYLSQILMKLLEPLISLQGIKVSLYICNEHEVILFLFGTINLQQKTGCNQSGLVFFCIVDPLGLVFKGLVAVPKYLNRSRPVGVASCLVLGKKNWT